jgi:hypothetical protein
MRLEDVGGEEGGGSAVGDSDERAAARVSQKHQ